MSEKPSSETFGGHLYAKAATHKLPYLFSAGKLFCMMPPILLAE
jgi:hypothetical protein